MTVQELINDISGSTGVAEQVLQLLAGLDPEVAVPAEILAAVLPLIEQYLSKALTAWSTASGTPITVESVTALLPNVTPLDKPTA